VSRRSTPVAPAPAKAEALATGAATRLSPRLRRLIAGNPSPFTFTGTCSYVVGEEEVAVVDPGPADAAHLDRLLAMTGGARVSHIVVTHSHRDHAAGATALRRLTGAPIFGARAPAAPADASHALDYAPDVALADGERIVGRGFTLEAVATPGHAASHLCFALLEDNALFSGDCVMAWSSTAIIPPDGVMADYMASLDKLRRRREAVYWPGHGGPVDDPQRRLAALARRRRQRETAILDRLAAGEADVAAIVAGAYAGLDPALVGAAKLSTLAHLEDLVARGLAIADGAPTLGARFRRASGLTASGSPPGRRR
jgi:glyoxylase-like metal-dependent hydrolase (beta-lactamase superfamily II)